MLLQGEMVVVKNEYWMVQYTEGQFPHYRYLFPIDPMQEILESDVYHKMKVNFTTRYHNYELVAWLHDTDRRSGSKG